MCQVMLAITAMNQWKPVFQTCFTPPSERRLNAARSASKPWPHSSLIFEHHSMGRSRQETGCLVAHVKQSGLLKSSRQENRAAKLSSSKLGARSEFWHALVKKTRRLVALVKKTGRLVALVKQSGLLKCSRQENRVATLSSSNLDFWHALAKKIGRLVALVKQCGLLACSRQETGCLVALIKQSGLLTCSRQENRAPGRSRQAIWTSDMLSSRKQDAYALDKKIGRLVAIVKQSGLLTCSRQENRATTTSSRKLSSRKQGAYALVKKTRRLRSRQENWAPGRSRQAMWASDMLSSRKLGAYALVKKIGRLWSLSSSNLDFWNALVKKTGWLRSRQGNRTPGRSRHAIWTSEMLSSRKQDAWSLSLSNSDFWHALVK